jgi:hypothetical protein
MGIIATGGQNKMRRRRLASIVAAAGLATIGALGLYLWRANAPAQHGVLTRESPRETRETFYLKTDAGFCVEIVARRGNDAPLLWWGHNISPKLAPELTDAQAIAVDYRTNEAVAWSKASFAGDTVHLRLPIVIDRVDVAYLRYAPSKQASAEGCGMQIASILSSTPPPWGRRVLSVQGGYRWREE